jgi:hypothetical protein
MIPTRQPEIHLPATVIQCKDITLSCRQARASEDINGIDYVEVEIEKPKVESPKKGMKEIKEIIDQTENYYVLLYLLKPAKITPKNIAFYDSDGNTTSDITFPDESAKEKKQELISENRPFARLEYKFEVQVTTNWKYNTYILKLHSSGNENSPLPNFDPLLSEAQFSFEAAYAPYASNKEKEENERDISAPPACSPPSLTEPEIDYLAKDYASFRQLALDRLALIMPDWRERHVPDLGIALVEVLAYVGDQLSYYQDAVATEAYLQTARQRISVRRHARLVDYHMHEGCNARALLCLTVDMDELDIDLNEVYFLTDYGLQLPLGKIASREHELQTAAQAGRYEVFEPVERSKKKFYFAHNQIKIYTWGQRQCCLPKGATHATLLDGNPLSPNYVLWNEPETQTQSEEQDERILFDEQKYKEHHNKKEQLFRDQLDEIRILHVKKKDIDRENPIHFFKQTLIPGDILIFEEVLDPGTGLPEDANPAHRHAVRLTKVTRAYDLAKRQALLEIEWAPEDALPFSLCLSATTDHCIYQEDISIARGNVILVDHGKTIEEALEPVPATEPQTTCDECGEAQFPAPYYYPRLNQHPLVFCEEIQPELSIQQLLQQRNPHAAAPQVKLSAVDELRVVKRFLDWLEKIRDIRDVPAVLEELVQALDKEGDISLAARAKAWEIKEQLEPWRPEHRHTTLEALVKICQDEIQKLSLELFDEESEKCWLARNDLFASDSDDRDFVVEVDDDGIAHLRFGDDQLGQRPAANAQFYARYRVGEALAGNVAAETIQRMIVRNGSTDGIMTIRNPLPAVGGAAPESLEEVKLRAPYAFRYQQLLRAINAEDYARLVEEHFPDKIQKTFAKIVKQVVKDTTTGKDRETGRYNVNIWYDQLSSAHETSDQMTELITGYLQPFRRIGHDLKIKPGEPVSLTVTVTVKIKTQAVWEHVRDALKLALGEKGFFDPDKLTFKTDISLSKLVATAQKVAGVEYISKVEVQEQVWPDTDGKDTDLMEFADGEIPKLGTLNIVPSTTQDIKQE